MHNINVVLVEPQIPQNTGNISRTCAVTGAKLHLIKPLGFTISDKKLKRAGLDYWDKLDVKIYENLDDFFNQNNGPYYYYTTKALNVYSDVKYENNCYIVFGREDKGLPEKLLFENKKNCVRIPMKPELRSLNLSNTVAIATYEILRQWQFPELNSQGQLTDYIWR